MTSCEHKSKVMIINQESQHTLTIEDASKTQNLSKKNDENFAMFAESGDRTDYTTDNLIDKISAEKSNLDANKRANYQRRLHTVAQHVEKLFAYCKMIESENNEQKEQINSVLQNFDKFTEKLEILSTKTSKIKQNFEEDKKPESPMESMNTLRQWKTHKKKSPTHFQIKAYILEDSMTKDKSSRKFDDLPKGRKLDVFSDSKLERKGSRHCHEISCDKTIGDNNKSFLQTCPNSLKTEVEDLRKIFINLKKSILMDPADGLTDASKDDTQRSNNYANDEKTVHAMSDMICQTIMKIFNKMLCEDTEKIKKDINAIDSEWKSAALSQEKERTIKEQLHNAKMMETVAKQLDSIQSQVEQISNTNKLLNARMLEQKQDIISLDGKLQAISSPNHFYDEENKEVLDCNPDWNQFYGNPDFVIAKLLRSVENIAGQLKSQKYFHHQNEETLGQSERKIMENGFNQSELVQKTLQAELFSPIKNFNDCKLPRNLDFQQSHLGVKSKVSAAQNEYPFNTVLSRMKISSPENSTKPSCRNTQFIANMNSARNPAYSSIQSPFLASTNCVSDAVSKEIDKHIPELFRVSRIPKLLDEIASSVAPLTMSKRRQPHQMANNTKRYHDVKKNTSLLKKNIFKNSTEIKHNGNKQKMSDVPKSLFSKKSGTLSLNIHKSEQHSGTINQNQESAIKAPVERAESKKKVSYLNAFLRKENLELYSKEFLASVKKSFVDIISNEIKKSITSLVAKEGSSVIKSTNSNDLNVTCTSISSLKPMCGSKSQTKVKLNSVSKVSVSKKSDQLLNLQYDLASKTELTSQITLACVQKFITAVESGKNLEKSMSFIFEGSSVNKILNNDKSLHSKPIDNQTEYFLQKFKTTAMPNFFVALPGVKIFDSFWGGTGSSFPAFAEKPNTNKECFSRENDQKIAQSNDANNQSSLNMLTCDCSCDSFSNSESSVND